MVEELYSTEEWGGGGGGQEQRNKIQKLTYNAWLLRHLNTSLEKAATFGQTKARGIGSVNEIGISKR